MILLLFFGVAFLAFMAGYEFGTDVARGKEDEDDS
jgi:hypothetical protein